MAAKSSFSIIVSDDKRYYNLVLVIILDLSVKFDTVHHNVPLLRLKLQIGFSDKPIFNFCLNVLVLRPPFLRMIG